MEEDHHNDKHLIDLIINQDHVAQNWIKFLLTIQSALSIAYWFLAKTAAGACQPLSGYELIALGLLIPFLACTACLTITKITVHERRWQAWYVERFKELRKTPHFVFPIEIGAIAKIPKGYISKVLTGISKAVIAGWIVAGGAVGLFGLVILIGHCPS
ncbi:MAG TPA: hypothetical protein VII49_01030 [Rhizomicrobium sp.]